MRILRRAGAEARNRVPSPFLYFILCFQGQKNLRSTIKELLGLEGDGQREGDRHTGTERERPGARDRHCPGEKVIYRGFRVFELTLFLPYLSGHTFDNFFFLEHLRNALGIEVLVQTKGEKSSH